ncbi:MAG TPA: CRTAC1 family protein [Cyclobacteriaceae bacterium]|nr:CRTAC1 family protein [Cyclobacteriaceae bacterium]
MNSKLTKRRKLLSAAWIAGVSFIILLILSFWLGSRSREIYTPGEKVDGLTAELARDLPPDYPKISFTDATASAGIRFRHFRGERTSQLPEDMGSGAAWGDYDNDGWQDLFIANFAGPISLTEEEIRNSEAACQLYHNNRDGTFKEVSKIAGVDIRDFINGAAWADFDSDGWPDLSVSCYGHNRLYRNKGDGTFTDVSKTSGIGNVPGFWSGLAWGDYNLDGHPDLYICGYVVYTRPEKGKSSRQYNAEVPASLNPSSFRPAENKLYRNNGNGTFRDVTEDLGVANEEGRSLSAVWCDFDADGWPDLYVANDVSDNVFYRNTGKGTFSEISHSAFVADYRGAMGLAVGDWNNDGDMDMFITHWIAQENALYDNMLTQITRMNIKGSHEIKFMDYADRFGLGQIALDYIGFGTFFFDYNNDGRLDIFVANGSTFELKDQTKSLVAMDDQLFWNRNDEEGFYNISPVAGNYFRKKYTGRGTAWADYDNDGDPDIFIVNHDGPGILLRNDGGNQNNWIEIKLLSAGKNRFGLGAKIKVVTAGLTQIRQVGTEGSYLSQNSLVQHFGLGESQTADTVEILWPDQHRQEFYQVPANRIMEIAWEPS